MSTPINKNKKVNVVVGNMSNAVTGNVVSKLCDYLYGRFQPKYETDDSCRLIGKDMIARAAKKEIEQMIKENDIREVVEAVLEERENQVEEEVNNG